MTTPAIPNMDVATSMLLRYAEPRESFNHNYPVDLDHISGFLAAIGNPQDQTRIVHVAGTSGKTSTSYFISALLRETGMSVGLTVSPHITSLTERIQINGQPIPDDEFLFLLETFLGLVEANNATLNYFQLLVAFAFWVFAERAVDWAVIETGVGGLYDGTNTVSRTDKICVITDIGLDHMELLGDSIEQIAMHKAGIIQQANHVFVLNQSRAALNVIVDRARTMNAELDVVYTSSFDATARSLPSFQQRNWLIARAVDEHIRARMNFKSAEATALQRCVAVQAPGRFERFVIGDKLLILDGAHNSQKMTAFHDSLKSVNVPRAAVIANFLESQDRNIESLLAALRPVASHLIVPNFSTMKDSIRKSIAPGDVVACARASGFPSAETADNPMEALLLLRQRPESVLIITGSLYLVRQLREQVIAFAGPQPDDQ